MVTATILGPYTLNDTSTIEGAIKGEVTGLSGTHIIPMMDAGNQKVSIIVLQEGVHST